MKTRKDVLPWFSAAMWTAGIVAISSAITALVLLTPATAHAQAAARADACAFMAQVNNARHNVAQAAANAIMSGGDHSAVRRAGYAQISRIYNQALADMRRSNRDYNRRVLAFLPEDWMAARLTYERMCK